MAETTNRRFQSNVAGHGFFPVGWECESPLNRQLVSRFRRAAVGIGGAGQWISRHDMFLQINVVAADRAALVEQIAEFLQAAKVSVASVTVDVPIVNASIAWPGFQT